MVQEKDDKSLDLGFNLEVELLRGFPGDSVVKNPPANSENVRDTGLIHGSGRSPGEGDAAHSSILAWRIRWTEEPGGL